MHMIFKGAVTLLHPTNGHAALLTLVAGALVTHDTLHLAALGFGSLDVRVQV